MPRSLNVDVVIDHATKESKDVLDLVLVCVTGHMHIQTQLFHGVGDVGPCIC